MMQLEDFKAARSVLSGVIRPTPLVHSTAFSKTTENHVYIKPENLQVTGAYKIRGAYYKISTLTQEEKDRGLVTASAGNHAQGVAYAAQHAGVSATVVMPTTWPYWLMRAPPELPMLMAALVWISTMDVPSTSTSRSRAETMPSVMVER